MPIRDEPDQGDEKRAKGMMTVWPSRLAGKGFGKIGGRFLTTGEVL